MNLLLHCLSPLPSLIASLAFWLVPFWLIRSFAPGSWAKKTPRPLLLFVASLAAPAFWLAGTLTLGFNAAWLSVMGLVAGGLGGHAISCCLGLAANASFLLGLLLRLTPWAGKARSAAMAALILGAVSLIPVVVLARESLIVYPGFVLWLLSFESLRRAAAPPAVTEEGQVAILGARTPARCGYCHEEDVATARACPTCGVELHEECWLKAQRCPTLGCAVRVKRLAGEAVSV